MEMKTETENKPSRPPRPLSWGTSYPRTPAALMKRSHWVIFIVISVLLGFLVFYTMLHVINTTTSKARAVHAPSPVETVPVRRQTLEEVIGGSRAVEQAATVNLTTQLNAQVLEVPVKIGDLIKKGDLLGRWYDRLIKATVQANREYVEADNLKIRDETRQVERYSTLQHMNMGTQLDAENDDM